MARQSQGYLSYLLRMWQTSDEGEQVWRASLERPGTGERRGFASVEELLDFLRAQAGEIECSDGPSAAVNGKDWSKRG